ncbi:restriction endonuclease [Rhabdaerophilum sp. SD176]|uniref:restriction endonuclease n=1 Tax=Rhabdaerophilum sp. SD176 TaxID=2983548 RepID=UPI0024DF8481|nr:restriction endonuclease [Rhabdaerophilum sp. SD176]
MKMDKRVPKFNDLMWPMIVVLREMGGSATIEELEEKVGEKLNISEDILSIPHGDTGRTQVGYRLAWARTYLKQFDALENSSRGVWSLTPKGRIITESEITHVPRIVRSLQKKAPEKLESFESDQEIEELSWKENLLAELKIMAPDAFERLCQRLLRESGFSKVIVSGRSGDGGIDGSGVLRINLVSFQVSFQCKRWKDAVSSSTIRDFRGAMIGRADKGLVITTGRFTADAQREAIRDGAPTIDLVDGDSLCELLKSLRLGVTIRMVEEVSVDKALLSSI